MYIGQLSTSIELTLILLLYLQDVSIPESALHLPLNLGLILIRQEGNTYRAESSYSKNKPNIVLFYEVHKNDITFKLSGLNPCHFVLPLL